MWTRSELKQRGKSAFRANYWRCVLIAVILTICVAGIETVTGRRAYQSTTAENSAVQNTEAPAQDLTAEEIGQILDENSMNADLSADDLQNLFNLGGIGSAAPSRSMPDLPAVVLSFGITLSTIGFVLKLLVFNPLEVGCQSFFTRNLNEKATYSYRMVPYILADDPECGAREAITRSRRMMNGHKWKAFVLDLSFIGWWILSIFTLGILLVFWVNPYQYSTNAALYERLKEENRE